MPIKHGNGPDAAKIELTEEALRQGWPHDYGELILSRRINMGGAMHILVKDVDLALELADKLGIPMWVCQAARLVFKHAMFEGRDNDDISTIVQVIERGAKFEIPKSR